MKTFIKHNGQVVTLEGSDKGDISSQASALGAPDPFAPRPSILGPRQKAKALYLELPVDIQEAFLDDWAAINNALDMGAKGAALLRLDGITVPAELAAAKDSIRAFLEQA